MDVNQELTPAEIQKIRILGDFDLTMLVSEIHDHGWGAARRILAMMPPANPNPPPNVESSCTDLNKRN